MKSLISVIVPCYNCEKTISKCIESVFMNDYDSLEVICINDGSTDSTLFLLKELNKKYPNMMIINQDNRRQGYARNRGIALSKGDYVVFLDADDTYEATFLSEMYNSVQGYDVAICSFNYVEGNNKKHISGIPEKEISVMEFWSLNFLNPVWSVVPWNKIYKRTIFNDVRFVEGTFYEDEFFATSVFSKTIKIYSSSKCLYNYYINCESTTHTNANTNKLYRAEARNIRSLFFIEQRWDDMINKTNRESLYLILKINDITKKEKTNDFYKDRINKCLKEIKNMTNNCLELRLNVIWDLYLFSKNTLFFNVLYFARKIMRIILRRDKNSV